MQRLKGRPLPARGHQSDPGDQAPEGGWGELCRWTIRISGQLPGNLQKQRLQTQGFPQTPWQVLLRPGMGAHGVTGPGAETPSPILENSLMWLPSQPLPHMAVSRDPGILASSLEPGSQQLTLTLLLLLFLSPPPPAASQPLQPASGQLASPRPGLSPWSSCSPLWDCPQTTSPSSSLSTGLCEWGSPDPLGHGHMWLARELP